MKNIPGVAYRATSSAPTNVPAQPGVVLPIAALRRIPTTPAPS